MRTSTIASSGSCSATTASSDSASPTRATTSWPASSSRPASPSRRSTVSSAITSRMGGRPRCACRRRAGWRSRACRRVRRCGRRDPRGPSRGARARRRRRRRTRSRAACRSRAWRVSATREADACLTVFVSASQTTKYAAASTLAATRPIGASTSTGIGEVRARSCSAAARPSSSRAGRTPAAIWRRSTIAEPTSPTIWSSAGASIARLARQRALHAADLQAERDEPLLGAVVEVALEPPALLVAGLDDPHARGLHLLQLQPDLDAQARDLDRERAGREDVPQRCRALEQHRVVQEHGRARALARDLGVRAAVVRQRGDELAGRGRVGLARGQPEDQLASGSRSAAASTPLDLLGRARALAHLVLERLHRAQAVGARPVEAAVDERLDAHPQRPERERDDERACRRHPVRAAADRDARRERDGDVGRREQQRQRAVDGRPVDQALDRVEPVADRPRCPTATAIAIGIPRMITPSATSANGSPTPQPAKHVTRPSGISAGHPGDPERLQALDARRAAQPQPDRDRAGEQAGEDADPERNPDPRRASPGCRTPAIGLGTAASGLSNGSLSSMATHRKPMKQKLPAYRDAAPAAREQAAVREHERHRDGPGIEQRPRRAAELQRPARVGDVDVERRRPRARRRA